MKKAIFLVLLSLAFGQIFGQTSACDVTRILHNPNAPVLWSPDSSKYLVNVQDTAGIFQIYLGHAGDTTLTCISTRDTTGNCCGLFRKWATRNKLQVQWHHSGNFIICGVEKEFYNELLYVPYPTRLGWLQSGLWMDIWALTPDGGQWYILDATIHGFTGPAFTPDGSKGAWAEALDSSNLAVDVFGNWKMRLSDFIDSAGTPLLKNTSDITPAGARWIEPGNFDVDGHSLLISSDIGLTNAEGQDQFILDISNGNVVNLTNTPMVWDEHGMFSPDGKKILFMSSYPYRADTNSYHTLSIKTEFMLMNRDGSGLQQLTHFRDTGYFESSPGIAATGFWSHNGTTIYAQSLIFPNYDNWIIEFNGNCGNDTVTSVNEIKRNNFRVFPNPTPGTLNIETAFDLAGAEIMITNTLGQTLKYISATGGNKISIETDELKTGIYLLRLKTGEQRIVETFIKSE